jgi:hypothetical protein
VSDNEVPIRVVTYPESADHPHHTETRVFAREIHESYCADPSCRFFGRPAVQGQCHTTTPFTDSSDGSGVSWAYVEASEKHADALLVDIRQQSGSDKDAHIRDLESHLYCATLNTVSTLDQLVRLRSKSAVLQDRCDKLEAELAALRGKP